MESDHDGCRSTHNLASESTTFSTRRLRAPSAIGVGDNRHPARLEGAVPTTEGRAYHQQRYGDEADDVHVHHVVLGDEEEERVQREAKYGRREGSRRLRSQNKEHKHVAVTAVTVSGGANDSRSGKRLRQYMVACCRERLSTRYAASSYGWMKKRGRCAGWEDTCVSAFKHLRRTPYKVIRSGPYSCALGKRTKNGEGVGTFCTNQKRTAGEEKR